MLATAKTQFLPTSKGMVDFRTPNKEKYGLAG